MVYTKLGKVIELAVEYKAYLGFAGGLIAFGRYFADHKAVV